MKLAVSSWSFRKPLQTGELKLAQVPAAGAMLGFEFVELNDVFLRPKSRGRTGRLLSALSREQTPELPPDLSPVRLGALEKGLRTAQVPLVCFTADNDFVPERAAVLEEQVRYARAVIGAARYLECRMVRLWLTPRPARLMDEPELPLEAFRRLTETAARAGVRLALEHRSGRREEIEALVQIVEQVRSYHLGMCLNFGHLLANLAGAEPDSWQASLNRLLPYTIHVHARSRAFDAAGNETTIPYPICLAALKGRGYENFISIEYEGEGDPLDGIVATRELIQRCW